MTAPRIIPTTFPLAHTHQMEFATWAADRLREAFTLGGRPMSDMDEANHVYAAVGKAGPVWAGYDPGSADYSAFRVAMPARRMGKSHMLDMIREATDQADPWVKDYIGRFLPEERDPLKTFWNQIEYLEKFHPGSVNLSRQPAFFLAINLPRYERQCREKGLMPVQSQVLQRLLTASCSPRFLDKRAYACADQRVRHCWLFQSDFQSAIDTPVDPYLGTR